MTSGVSLMASDVPAPFLVLPCTAVMTSDMCSAVNGTWAPAACKVSQQPSCAAAGGSWSPRTMWSLEGGLDMLCVGLLQGALSYPFFDPVLTGDHAKRRTCMFAVAATGPCLRGYRSVAYLPLVL